MLLSLLFVLTVCAGVGVVLAACVGVVIDGLCVSLLHVSLASVCCCLHSEK